MLKSIRVITADETEKLAYSERLFIELDAKDIKAVLERYNYKKRLRFI